MPTASADELGNIYQFVGTTDANYTNGYFYKCVSDGQQPATYSWSQVSVQPTPSGLPSQTGQSGKFLTTDGTDASWGTINALQNTATGSNSLTILGTANTNQDGINIGVGSVGHREAVVIGHNATSNRGNIIIGDQVNGTNASYGVAIGTSSRIGTILGYEIAIGTGAKTSAAHAIQLGSYGSSSTNSDANTFKVGNANGNFEIMSADGTVPHARLTNAVVSNSITIAVADWNGGTTCTKTVSGLTATSTVWVAPDNASQSDYLTAGVYASAQTTDTITFTCATTPTSSLTVNIIYC